MKQALEMALEFIERVNKHGWILADFEPEMYKTINAIKEALAQQCPWIWLNWDDLPEDHVGDKAFLQGAKWAEAKLREKNT